MKIEQKDIYASAPRQSGVELLRIVAALSVILIHVGDNTLSSLKWGCSNQIILNVIESYTHCAVNIFILITGYFSCTSDKRSLGKPASLIIQVFIVSVLRYVGAVFSGNAPLNVRSALSFCTPNNYFVILFIALYFISPYLNHLLRSLSSIGQKRLVIITIALFSLYPVFVDVYGEILGKSWFGLSSIGAWGNQQGFNIVNFCLVYIIGAFMRLNNITERLTFHKASVLLGFSVLIVFVWAECCHYFTHLGLISAWVYHNPFMIIMAVSTFVVFHHLHFTSRVVNSLAGAAFMCYIFHVNALVFINLNAIVQKPSVVMLGYLCVIILTMYIIAWFLKILYDFVFARLINRLDKVVIEYYT